MQPQYLGILPDRPGLPVISSAIIHGDRVFLRGVTPSGPGDAAAQTRQVLTQIDDLLAQAGTDKSKLLTAQVWLSDMREFAAHNEVWNAWVDSNHPPVRACVEAKLVHPAFRVEIMVTAAR